MTQDRIYLTNDAIPSIVPYVFPKDIQQMIPWTPQKRPAVLILPGGGYAHVSDREGHPIALSFMQRGYQAFVLDYTTGLYSNYPRPVFETLAAIRYLRANAEKYAIDPDAIALVGFSAGGHLAALTASQPENSPLFSSLGITAADVAINALILGYPLVDLNAFVDRLNRSQHDQPYFVGAMIRDYHKEKDPLALVSEHLPPTFIFHTLEDDIITPEDTLAYTQALRQKGVTVEYHLYSAGGHGLSTADSLSNYGRAFPKRIHSWMGLAQDWLNEVFEYDF